MTEPHLYTTVDILIESIVEARTNVLGDFSNYIGENLRVITNIT
jgi:hypothetical protein